MFSSQIKYFRMPCLLILALIFIQHPAFSGNQNDDPVLFTFGKEEVRKSEFAYVYEKHNSQDTALYSKASVDDYLDLYVKFKLKVKEAEMHGLDTVPQIRMQLQQYRDQLAQGYLYDREISEQLVQEAYNRLSKEVKTKHLLIMVNENASPQDTLTAFNRITKIREEVLEGKKSFSELAKANSQDPSVSDNGGDLGFITAFQTVYPFESAAYNTKVGEVSKPIRTKFGYHLVKTEEIRPAKGKVKAAHILIKVDPKASEEVKKEKEIAIKKLYKLAKKGKVSFEDLAQNSSEDKQTSKKGGSLDWFGTGKMLPEFENATFALSKKGEVSKPVRTKLGWHIIKLLDTKTLGSFEEMQKEIRKKVEKDSRSKVSKRVFINRLKKEYQFEEFAGNKDVFFKIIDNSIIKGRWKAVGLDSLKKPLFSLSLPAEENKSTEFSQFDFAKYMEGNQIRGRNKTVDATVNQLYSMYIEEALLAIEDNQLEKKYPDFAKLMKEFRDGTLLFDLTEKEVWNKALQDTSGLNAFYQDNQGNYKWDERADAVIVNCVNADMARLARTMLINDKKPTTEIEKQFNLGGASKKAVELKEGTFERNQNDLLAQIDWKVGVTEDIPSPDGRVQFVIIKELIPAGPKALNEARGYVVADYQNFLEAKWIDVLKSKYPVKLMTEEVETLYK